MPYKNPENKVAYDKKYFKENKEEINKRVSEWAKNNRDKRRSYARKRRAKKLAINENYTIEDEAYTRALFGYRCANCGCTETHSIDHHFPLERGNALTRGNAVLLCVSCNCKKGIKPPEDFYSREKLNYITDILEGTDIITK